MVLHNHDDFVNDQTVEYVSIKDDSINNTNDFCFTLSFKFVRRQVRQKN